MKKLILGPGQFRWAICGGCEGHGQVDNPAFSQGFTSSEWNDMDIDERAEYLDGTYDVNCRECRGAGKVQEPIISALSWAQKRQIVEARRKEAYQAEAAAERLAEQRMGC